MGLGVHIHSTHSNRKTPYTGRAEWPAQSGPIMFTRNADSTMEMAREADLEGVYTKEFSIRTSVFSTTQASGCQSFQSQHPSTTFLNVVASPVENH